VTAIPHILIVTSDRKLRDELGAAVAGMAENVIPVVKVASDVRQGLQMARNRPPDLIAVEMGSDRSALRTFAREVSATAPDTTIAAVFNPETLGAADGSESAILIEALRAGVKDFLRRPVSTAELEQLLRRTREQTTRLPSALGIVVSFISNKGGVGKTTLAVNTSCALALRHPGRVLLVDASLQLGMAASMLDLKPAATLTDAVRERDRLDVTLIRQLATPHPSGLHVLAAPGDAVEAADVDDELVARVLTLAQRAYDYVVVDTFPMLDRVVVAVLDFSDRVYMVMENVVPVLLGASKLLQLLDGLGFPEERQRLVINRYQSLTGSLKLEEVASRLGRTIDYVLPYDKRLIMAANSGQPPVMRSGPFHRYKRALRPLVDGVDGMLAHLRNGRLDGEFRGAARETPHAAAARSEDLA
jgi:pilus assembly protein CpaE